MTLSPKFSRCLDQCQARVCAGPCYCSSYTRKGANAWGFLLTCWLSGAGVSLFNCVTLSEGDIIISFVTR